ncbi:hypothetical protein GN241_11055 [Rhodobacteraceae bacterium IMCC1335]
MRVSGHKQSRARSRRRSKAVDANVAAAISETVVDVHRAGVENIDAMVSKRSGRLRKFYKKSLRAKGTRGLVGYVSAKARRAAFYARFVHDGTSRQKARPFHDHAVLEFEGKHTGRMRAALRKALSGRASPSGLARTGGGRERNI